jgi:hypothetical protein
MARCELNQVNQRLMRCNKRRVCIRRVNGKTKSGGRMGKKVARHHVKIVTASQAQYLHWISLVFSFPSPRGTMWLCYCVHEFIKESQNTIQKNRILSMIRYMWNGADLHSSVPDWRYTCFCGRTFLYTATSGGAAEHHTIRVGVTGFDFVVTTLCTLASGKPSIKLCVFKGQKTKHPLFLC